MAPRSLRVAANGLSHHVLEWSGRGTGPTAVLVHGFMDAAATWDLVAPTLEARGMRVLATDMRGFGDGPRVPAGAYYYFPDYVMDLAELVEALVPPGEGVVLVGHSMGGTIATLYAGTCPPRVARLVVVEGAGPPDSQHEHVPDRFRGWLDGVRRVRSRGERTMGSRTEALARLVQNHPRVAEEVLATRLDALAREVPGGRLAWKADPLHATSSPVAFFAGTFKEFVRRVECPALFVSGGPLGWHPPDEEERVACFRQLTRLTIDDAGHMMHWTHPAELAGAIAAFAGA